MVGTIEKFGHFNVARRAGGSPVELLRSPDELVFLSFDTRIKRLVELHILRSGNTLDSVAKKSAFERSKQASEIRGSTFMRILEVGEDQGLVYYTSNLNDGEFAADYVARRGPLPPATAFALVYQLLDDLIRLQNYRRLVARMRIDRVLVSTLEDTFLHLRVCDYGLSTDETGDLGDRGHLVAQACQLIFLLLTGQSYGGENPDRFPALTALPMSLRLTLRTALGDPANAPTSLEKLRDDLREGFSALVSSIQARNARKQIVVTPALQPRSQLQDLLLENVPVEIILGNRFRAEDADDVRRYPFSIPAVNAKTDQPITVHLLPPSRIVDKSEYEAVPLQMWRFNPDRHPNILRSLSLWESPDWTFLTEEREPGFALSRLMAERIFLNPAEVLVLLRQISSGLEQAMECGVSRVDLHPSNIVLRVGKAGPLLAREYERLMQKRIDAWPTFLLKLRPHLTMRNLYEPLLVDRPEDGEHEEAHLADRDFRNRAFVALAAYLLTGERQAAATLQFTEAVPEQLANFVRDSLEQAKFCGRTPPPVEFLERFENFLNAPAGPDLATRLRGQSVAVEEMESAGSVSDFDEDWSASADDNDEPITPIARSIKTHDFNVPKQGNGIGWPVMAAAAAIVVAGVAWWMMPSGSSSKPEPISITSVDNVPPANAPEATAVELAAPVKAAVPTQAPEVAKEVADVPPPPPTATVAAVPAPMPAPMPAAAVPETKVEEPAKPVVQSAPVESKPVIASMPPVPEVGPKKDEPVPEVPAIPTAAPTVASSVPAAANESTPPAGPQGPVMIRKAILPTAEELQQLKQQGQAKNEVGTVPTISPARPAENLADRTLR